MYVFNSCEFKSKVSGVSNSYDLGIVNLGIFCNLSIKFTDTRIPEFLNS